MAALALLAAGSAAAADAKAMASAAVQPQHNDDDERLHEDADAQAAAAAATQRAVDVVLQQRRRYTESWPASSSSSSSLATRTTAKKKTKKKSCWASSATAAKPLAPIAEDHNMSAAVSPNAAACDTVPPATVYVASRPLNHWSRVKGFHHPACTRRKRHHRAVAFVRALKDGVPLLCCWERFPLASLQTHGPPRPHPSRVPAPFVLPGSNRPSPQLRAWFLESADGISVSVPCGFRPARDHVQVVVVRASLSLSQRTTDDHVLLHEHMPARVVQAVRDGWAVSARQRAPPSVLNSSANPDTTVWLLQLVRPAIARVVTGSSSSSSATMGTPLWLPREVLDVILSYI